jgi:hypothetical protein
MGMAKICQEVVAHNPVEIAVGERKLSSVTGQSVVATGDVGPPSGRERDHLRLGEVRGTTTS